MAYELVYMPYLTMGHVESVAFGSTRVWNFDVQSDLIEHAAVRARVAKLLAMHREPGRNPVKGGPLRGVGVAAIGNVDMRPLTDADFRDVLTLRLALFLAALARNVTLRGPNAGHDVYTADNFELVRQPFTLDSEYVGERTGVIVARNLMGYRIDETLFPTPSHVNRPMRFDYDNALLDELRKVRRRNVQLYRRMLRATDVFIGSYYNSHTISLAARVLLQASAFEVLLELPDSEQRRRFKDEVERLISGTNDRRYQYQY